MAGANQMRTWIEMLIQVSQDPDLRQQVINQKRIRADYTSTSTTGPGPGQGTLAPGVTDFLVPFGSVIKASLVYVVSFDDIQFRLGSITAPLLPLLTIPPDSTGNPLSNEEKYKQPGLMVIAGTSLTSLYLTNMSLVNPAGYYVGLIGEAP